MEIIYFAVYYIYIYSIWGGKSRTKLHILSFRFEPQNLNDSDLYRKLLVR